MKFPRYIYGPFLALVATTTFAAPKEKLLAQSPDGRFALRIVYSEGTDMVSPWLNPELIRLAEIVTLPAKVTAVSIAEVPEGESRSAGPEILWSADSKWFVFTGLGEGFRDTNILIFRLAGGKFVDVPVDGLTAEATPPKGATDDLRAEFVKPIRWVQPGALLFRQDSNFRVKSENASGAVSQEITSAFSEAKNAFQVVSRKKVQSPDELARAADARLNAAYKELQATLSASGKAALKQEQITWLAQRDAITDADQQAAFVEVRAVDLRKRVQAIR